MADVRARVEGWLGEMHAQYCSGRSTGLSAHVDAFGTGELPRTMWLTTGLELWRELCDAVVRMPEFEPAFAIEVEGDVVLGEDSQEAFVRACDAQLHEFTPPELYVFGREDVDAVATQLAQQGRRVGGLQLGARRHVVMQTTGTARYGSEVETFRVLWVLPLGSTLLAKLPT
jgi:hypothetical protein